MQRRKLSLYILPAEQLTLREQMTIYRI